MARRTTAAAAKLAAEPEGLVAEAELLSAVEALLFPAVVLPQAWAEPRVARFSSQLPAVLCGRSVAERHPAITLAPDCLVMEQIRFVKLSD